MPAATKKISETHELNQEFEALGTKNQITIFHGQGKNILLRAIERVMEIDDKMSVYKPTSEIAQLNQSAGRFPVKMSLETLRLLEESIHMGQISNGAFDVTIGPIVALWGIGKKGCFIPSQAEIDESKKLVNYQDIVLDMANQTAYLKKENQSVDLGGIAKGYAADEVKRILAEGGVTCAMINLGGNIIVMGNRKDDTPWKIGIQNPVAPTGVYVGVVEITDQTMVTSGTNERFFIKNGVRYHHLLNPRIGKPSQSGIFSVTVVCEKSMIADALTTALFVLGMEAGMKLLNEFDAQAIFLTEEGQIYITEGLREKYHACLK